MSRSVRTSEEVHRIVRERYGEIARAGGVAAGSSCSPATPSYGSAPAASDVARDIGYASEDVAAVPDGANLGLGCGAPLAIADLRPGETVLDLGSGAGFDAFLAARQVSSEGRVLGVDMTPEMLERARRNAKAGGFQNVEFREGRIESLPVESSSVDVVISNCVINLAPDKPAVFREVARVLRPGGRMIVSDVVLEEPLPEAVADDVNALVGCVAGASLRDDYLDAIRAAGLEDIEVLRDTGFGEVVLGFVPEELLLRARNAGIDVTRVAGGVRSITVRGRKH